MVRAKIRQEFVSTEELLSQLREQGIQDVKLVKVARMEPDGQLSVVKQEEGEHASRRTRTA